MGNFSIWFLSISNIDTDFTIDKEREKESKNGISSARPTEIRIRKYVTCETIYDDDNIIDIRNVEDYIGRDIV